MGYIEIFFLALALSADAFSVGASIGLLHREARQVFRLSFHFGLFQSIFTLTGALIGSTLLIYVSAIDHWIAFSLLTLLGGWMVYKSFHPDEDEVKDIDFTRGLQLIGLSTAVSIDALAAGVGLPAVKAPIGWSVLIIGIVASLATLIAMFLADHLKQRLGKKIEIMAGIVLIILGVSILYNHHVFR